MATLYIAQLTDFSREKEEMDMHTWLKKAQKAIQANNWNDQRSSKLISSHGLMTKEQDYQPYQLGGVKEDPNRTRQVHKETVNNADQN
ncbi:hypothetical protein G9A89_021617 [Geosiphon pyriformis]|nr:hypothetical protein G9A89_021617 [Geosiphon pyriformis]